LKDKIWKALNTFYDTEVHPLLSSVPQFPAEYVIDFAFSTTSQNNYSAETIDWEHPIIIEINPFHSSDTCLFDRGRDNEILLGKKEQEFRIVERPMEDLRHIAESWRIIINNSQ
jgi:hypothetical protein